MARFRLINILLAITLLVSGCLAFPPISKPGESSGLTGGVISWTYADLRMLDPPDAPLPTQDIIAAYIRIIHPTAGFKRLFSFQDDFSDEIQVRLDLLDLNFHNDCDIYLALDHRPGGTSALPGGYQAQMDWDTLILLPAFGQIQAWDDQNRAIQNLSIHTIRDPILDTLEINLNASKLPGAMAGIRLQVITTQPGTDKITDQLDPFQLSDQPPPAAPVLFAFWNAFPAYTPAQSLRRWDGAHTGPLGGRHGLYNLLRAARNYHIPLALLDLKSPASLSALDYVDGLPIVQRMAAENLLILPDNVPQIGSQNGMPADFTSMASGISQQTALVFQINASPFIYASVDDNLPANYPVVMTTTPGLNQAGHPAPGMGTLMRWREKTVIVIPNELLSEQLTHDTLSLDARKALVWTALLNTSRQTLGESIYLTLGGDLPNSEWGVPQLARAGFRYLQAHPWIRPLYDQDLLAARPVTEITDLQEQPFPTPSNTSASRNSSRYRLVNRLTLLPLSEISQDAWQFLFSLYGPQYPHPAELEDLRSIYTGQLGVLLTAASWASKPFSTSSCDSDLDEDGLLECLLSSEKVFVAFKVTTGMLTHLFVKTPSGFHQVIAPSTQFVIGLGEPSSWNLNKGLNADPAAIPGAFSIENGTVQPVFSSGKLTFKGEGIEVVYQTTSNGLSVEYRTDRSIKTRIPLALDPWVRFTPTWGERLVSKDTVLGWNWEIESGPRVQVRTNARFTPSRFNETRKMMVSMEDPNVEFPPGHFLPFPLSVLTLESTGSFFVDIALTN